MKPVEPYRRDSNGHRMINRNQKRYEKLTPEEMIRDIEDLADRLCKGKDCNDPREAELISFGMAIRMKARRLRKVLEKDWDGFRVKRSAWGATLGE
jgi:hypothetical protein